VAEVLFTSVSDSIREHGEVARGAVRSEIANMVSKEVFAPARDADYSKGEVIRSFVFMKDKLNPDGSLSKVKARLVANGAQQKEQRELVSSPTVSTTALFALIAIATREGYFVATADVGAAYLNARVPEETRIFVRIDRSFAQVLVELAPEYSGTVGRDGSVVVRLKKALYGCVQSAKLWFDELSGELVRQGLKQLKTDRCIFVGDGVVVALYVDDLFFAADDSAKIERIVGGLRSKYGEVSASLSRELSFLGMQLSFGEGETKVGMSGYIQSAVQSWGGEKSCRCPAAKTLFDVDDSAALDGARRKAFHSMVARLMYLAKRVRPDIMLPVVFLSTRVSIATVQDEEKLDRVIGYLKGSPDLGLKFSFPNGVYAIAAYMDASFGVHSDYKSHSGALIKVGGGVVYVSSRKQRIVTRSSWEAEVVAVSDNASQLVWLLDLLEEMGRLPDRTVLWQDNKGAVESFARGETTSKASRHVNVRHFWVKEHVDRGRFEIAWIPTEEMLADGLTKPLTGSKFIAFRNVLLNGK
jgi:hypothetical protein